MIPDSSNVYKIKYVDIDNNNDNTADNYAGDPDEQNLEKN